MLSTYRAIVNGNQITWLDTPRAQLDGVEVNITPAQHISEMSDADRRHALEEVLTRSYCIGNYADRGTRLLPPQ
jgi:hypothetical protein